MADALASAPDALEELGWDDRRVHNGIAALQSIVDINHFRQRVRAFGVCTQYRNAAGHWVNDRKADMLEDCRRRQGYKARVTTGRSTDCDNSMHVGEKGSFPALFAKQRGVAP